MNIVVLCAGTSTEREVSIITGKMVCKALREKGHNARVLDIFMGTEKDEAVNVTNFFEGDYDIDKASDKIVSFNAEVEKLKNTRKVYFGKNVIEICQRADIVFMALHGSNGEDGRVQGAFDLFGIKYTGTGYLGSALAMDKRMTKIILEAAGVPTAKGFSINRGETIGIVEKFEKESIPYPVVVKPCCGGSSIGVSIANNNEEFMEAVNEAFSYENNIVVEQYIKGREFSVGVVNSEAYPVIEIIPLEGFYDYTNKYQAGKTEEHCPAKISAELTGKIQEYAVLASKALELGSYSRIDFLVDENEKIYCLEANTLPGMTPTSLLPQEAAAIGKSFGELCEILINRLQLSTGHLEK